MLMGREDEQRTLDALVSGARVGRSGVLVLDGEAGIGKTALLDHAVDRATDFRVLRGVGTPAEHDLPFAGLSRVLGPLVSELDDLPEPQSQALGVALALRAVGAADRFAVCVATLTLLTRAAESSPVAVVIDDAHLLDPSSAQVLAFVARRVLVDAVVVLVAVRPGESEAWHGLPLLHVGPIAEDAAQQLAAEVAAERLTAEQRRQVVDLGAGNPLAIRALAAEPDVLGRPFVGPTPVPQVIAEAFARRTADLHRDALRVLQVAVTADGDLPIVTEVCSASGLEVGLLAEAEELGIVTLSPYRVEFTHPLVASAVYVTLSPVARRQLHLEVGTALSVVDPDRAAWHRSEATIGADPEVAAELEEVGRRASARGAFAVAASAHERAGTLSGDAGSRAGRFFAAGQAAWLAGEDRRALRLLDEAARHAPSTVARARAHGMAGQVAARAGSLARSRDLLLAAAGECEGQAPDEALRMYAGAIDACLYLLDARAAGFAAERAARLIATAGGGGQSGATPAQRVTPVADIAVGMGLVINGESGSDSLRRGVDTLVSRDGGGHEDADWAATGLLYLRETGAARELLDQAIRGRRRASELGHLPHLLFHLARIDATTSRWTRAESLYSEAIDLAREFGQLTELGASLAGIAVLHARQGRVEDCRRSAAEVAVVAEGGELRLASVWAGCAVAELDLSRGEVNRAIEGFDSVARLLDQLGVGDPDLSPAPELVEALIRVGDVDRAGSVNVAFRASAEHKGRPWSLARSARATALLGTDDEIDELFGAALRLHDEGIDDFERARTVLLHGSRLRRARRRVDARTQLRAARDTFDRLGAVLWSEAASAELEASGLRAHARDAGAIRTLTAREHQIAELLAGGGPPERLPRRSFSVPRPSSTTCATSTPSSTSPREPSCARGCQTCRADPWAAMLDAMPRRNRVDPWGDLVAHPGRGLFTGNRGCVVDDHENVVRHHGTNLPWITCVLRFKDWRVGLARPRRWTPLFFLDDAVALAAGHRPCSTCRRADFVAYRDAVGAAAAAGWGAAGEADGSPAPTLRATELDRRLRDERLGPGRGRVRAADRLRWRSRLVDLPEGTVVLDADEQPCLLAGGGLRAFGFDGWGGVRAVEGGRHTGDCSGLERVVEVLTPPTSVAALAHGFVPTLHPTVTPHQSHP